MAGITYMQRRPGSGIYQFRKRLPKELAGQVAPDHVKCHLPELINADTGCFKRELVVSLGTNDLRAQALKLARNLHSLRMANLAGTIQNEFLRAGRGDLAEVFMREVESLQKT